MVGHGEFDHMFVLMHTLTQLTDTIPANKAKMTQKKRQQEKWLEVMKRYGKGTETAKDVIALVKTGQNPIVFCSTSEQMSLIRHTPATDVELLSVPAPIIPPGTMAFGRVIYDELQNIGQGGFGEIFKAETSIVEYDGTGTESGTEIHALKRSLPRARISADIETYLSQQIHRLETLQREAEVYFSAVFNTRTCHHLALLHDVAQVWNSDGDQEPLLVIQWADCPCSTLGDWLKKHTSVAITIKDRLSFAIQMCAGLRELHNEDTTSSGQLASSPPAHKDSATEAATSVSPPSTSSSAFVHHDLKPGNILLFGGGNNDKGGPIRLALTDFGLTVRCNSGVKVGGTATYMAPEQWLGQTAVTPARDMWAAGLVLAELFGVENTLLALEKYRHCCLVARNSRTVGQQAKIVKQLCLMAFDVADAMALDSTQGNSGRSDARSIGVVPTDCVQVTNHVQCQVATILRECFVCDSNWNTPLGASRLTSSECEHRFIHMWDDVFGRLPTWSTFLEGLPKPRMSPFAQIFDADERRGTYHRLVESRLLKLMLKRCDSLLQTAQEKHADVTALQCLHDRLKPHKHDLQKKVIKSLESAYQCFESALCTIKIPVCAHCGRQQIRTIECEGESSSKPPATVLMRGDNGNLLYECTGCHAIRFCSKECQTQYDSTDWGILHHKGGGCQLLSSWRQKGWPVVGVVQATELVLLRGEAWEAEDEAEEDSAERDNVIVQFAEVQNAWERVYINGPPGNYLSKYVRGITLGVSRCFSDYTGADIDVFSPMMQACTRGLSALVGAVLDAPSAVVGPMDCLVNHSEPRYGITPLYTACVYGHIEVVQYLLDKAADTIDVNQATTDDGSTPLFMACRGGHKEIVAMLMDKAQDTIEVNRANTDDGCTPLFSACQRGHAEVVALLLDKARDVIDVNQAKTDGGFTPLYIACQENHTEVVVLLLDKAREMIDVNQTVDEGVTPLLMACQEGNAEVVALLLDKAQNVIDVNSATSDDRCGPLVMACQNGHSKVVALLLDKARDKIDVNQATIEDGFTPLFLACQEGHTEVVALLLDKAQNTIDVNKATTDDGSTPLFAACLDGHAEVVALLLDKTQDRINVNQARTDSGATPLLIASANGHVEVVTLLLDKAQDTVDVNLARTDYGCTPLLIACENGHAEVVALLLDKARDSIDVNQGTADVGCTPLLMASQNGHAEVVALLLDKARDKVDVNRPMTDVSATPLFLASQNGHSEVVTLILDKARDTIDVNCVRTDNGSTPLFAACLNGHAETVALLLDKARDTIDVNRATTDDGFTPLHIACQAGHTEVVTVLLTKARDRIDINRMMATDRCSPLSMAFHHGHSEIKAMLLEARNNINTNYLYRLFLVRLPVCIVLAGFCRVLFRRRTIPIVWIVFGFCCWALHRYTKLFWQPADSRVGLFLLCMRWRFTIAVLRRVLSRFHPTF